MWAVAVSHTDSLVIFHVRSLDVTITETLVQLWDSFLIEILGISVIIGQFFGGNSEALCLVLVILFMGVGYAPIKVPARRYYLIVMGQINIFSLALAQIKLAHLDLAFFQMDYLEPFFKREPIIRFEILFINCHFILFLLLGIRYQQLLLPLSFRDHNLTALISNHHSFCPIPALSFLLYDRSLHGLSNRSLDGLSNRMYLNFALLKSKFRFPLWHGHFHFHGL